MTCTVQVMAMQQEHSSNQLTCPLILAILLALLDLVLRVSPSPPPPLCIKQQGRVQIEALRAADLVICSHAATG